MTDPAAFAAAQQQQQLAAANYNAQTLMYLQQQQQFQQQQYQQAAAGQGAAAAAAAARPQPSKPISRAPSRPAPSRQQSRRREYDSDDDDEDEFEDYSHLLSQAEREKRKKKLVGSGDRESDDDFMSPPESSSSSEEEESSTDEEEEDDGEGEVTTSEEEDFGYGPPKKDRELQMARRRRGSDSESDGERRRSSKAKSDGRDQFLRTVDPALRRQLLRFFEAVMKQNQNKKSAGANNWPALPAISLSLAEWDKADQQRMAFCELLNLCPVEAKADKPEPYHYPRQTCATGINYYCTFQPDRPQPAKSQPAPNPEWVKRFEDRVKQWFALEPIGAYMQTVPALTAEEKTADAAYVAAIAQATNPTAAPAAAAAAGGSGKQKKNKRDEGSDDEKAKRGGNADGQRKKQKTKKGDSDEDAGDQKSAAAAAAAGVAPVTKGMAPPQPALPQQWRTLFLQQMDVSIRRQILQLYAATNPDRLIQGHRENFSSKYGKDLIGINFERACELSGVTPKMYDAKAAQLHVLNYFNFRPNTPLQSLQLPTPSFVYAFQTQVREWLRSAPVQALLASEYYVQPDQNAVADDAEFLKAQTEARALPPVEFAYSVPGLPAVPPVVKSGPA